MTLLALCPDCPPVHQARALVFGSEFLSNLGATLSPFVVMLGVVALIVRSVGRRGQRAGSPESRPPPRRAGHDDAQG